MNADPVLIDDDDMEPVVIIDDNNCKTNGETSVLPTLETIVLDDEPQISELNTENHGETARTDETLTNMSEISFRNNLANNQLLQKIIKTCLNMENAVGMPRVINKTLIPLYRDTNNKYKESDGFRKLLKKTLKMLIRDPNHKFLHIKTLCEELKSGGLRKKVPFVTLATNLRNNDDLLGNEVETCQVAPQTLPQLPSQHLPNPENDSIPRKVGRPSKRLFNAAEINGNSSRGVHKNQINRKVANVSNTIKKRRKIKRRWSFPKKRLSHLKTNSTITTSNTEMGKIDVIELDNSDNETVQRTENENSTNDVIVIEETEPNDITNENLIQVGQEEDSNKENNLDTQSKITVDKPEPLLIPTKYTEIQADEHTYSNTPSINMEVKEIENTIAYYKNVLARLEEQEVVDNTDTSPYIQADNVKKIIVSMYKKLCEISGDPEKIVKRREIRLHVAKGHLPGPAKRLERYLNETIDNTGTVAFPDFTDVVNCVMDSNMSDDLGWNKQRVLKEATALFRQCGQALRKRRQKREYRDLLSLVREKEQSDDPADRDPVLQAKLEENKLIAKIKEQEILERYVNMENNRLPGVANLPVGNNLQIESEKDSSDSDCDREIDISLRNNVTTAAINSHTIAESSTSSSNSLDVRLSTSLSLIPHAIHNGPEKDIVNDTYVHNPIQSETQVVNPPVESPNHVMFAGTLHNQYAVRRESTNSNLFIHNSTNMSSVAPNNFLVLTLTPASYNETSQCTKGSDNINNNHLNITPSTFNVSIASETNNANENSEITNRSFILTGASNHSSCVVDKTIDQKDHASTIENVKVKIEDVIKTEPIDVQKMLDELGDNFVSTVFDIEDPFLVIEISSDEFSDDDVL